MFLRILVAMMLFFSISSTALAGSNDWIADRLQLACPTVSHVMVGDDGSVTWLADPADTNESYECIAENYAKIIFDPSPVSPGDDCHTTSATVSDGKIILGC